MAGAKHVTIANHSLCTTHGNSLVSQSINLYTRIGWKLKKCTSQNVYWNSVSSLTLSAMFNHSNKNICYISTYYTLHYSYWPGLTITPYSSRKKLTLVFSFASPPSVSMNNTLPPLAIYWWTASNYTTQDNT